MKNVDGSYRFEKLKIFKIDLNSSAFKRLGGKIIFNGSEKENMLPSESRSGAKFGKSDNC